MSQCKNHDHYCSNLTNRHIHCYPDWQDVIRDTKKIIWNPSISPLRIKTDSAVGSGEVLSVMFYNVGPYIAGGVRIYFSDPIKYELDRCTTSQSFHNLPDKQDKIWTIIFHRNSGKTEEVSIECNSVEVARVSMSSCNHSEKIVYNQNPTQLEFQVEDTASDFVQRGSCQVLQRGIFLEIKEWFENLDHHFTTDTQKLTLKEINK